MTQYREILRLYQRGISQRSIALSCKCSRNTVSAVLQRAREANLQWPVEEKTDAELEALLFPEISFSGNGWCCTGRSEKAIRTIEVQFQAIY